MAELIAILEAQFLSQKSEFVRARDMILAQKSISEEVSQTARLPVEIESDRYRSLVASLTRNANAFHADRYSNSNADADALTAGAARLRTLAQSSRHHNEAMAALDPDPAEIIALLGGDEVIGALGSDAQSLARAIAAGFSPAAVTKLREAGYTTQELSSIVAPERTLRVRTKTPGERLTAQESDACERLARALVHGRRALGGDAATLAWLRAPHRRFGHQPGLALLRSSVGLTEVINALGQAEYGHPA